MVSFRKSKNYIHSSLLDEDGLFRPKSILIVGGTGSGKSITKEDMIEAIEENQKNTITISLVDVMDTFECAFPMFPATEKNHLKKLEQQFEQPEAIKKVKLWCFFGKGLKEWQKKHKQLPSMEIVTLGAKSILQRQGSLFLLETERENKSVRLMMSCGDALKKDEGLNFIKYYGNKLTKRKTTSYLGKHIDTGEEPIADKGDLKDVMAVLHLFDYDGTVMPEGFKHNFDIRKLLNERGTRQVLVYKGLKKDEKLRDFVFFYVLNEIAMNITDCKYPVILDIEETQSKAPFKGKGHKEVLSTKVGDIIGTVRKTGRGVTTFMAGRSWNKIAEEVRSECRKQIIFHLEQDDMLKYVKAQSLSGKKKNIIENLGTGEYIHRGYESRICKGKMPKHNHKHVSLDFYEMYKKFFPDKMKSYNEIIKEIDAEHKLQIDKMLGVERSDLDKQKRQIKRQVTDRARTDRDKEEVLKYKEEDKKRKEEDKKKKERLIIDTRNEMAMNNEKISFRKISQKLKEKGINVSYVTVKTVLDNFTSTERAQGNDSE